MRCLLISLVFCCTFTHAQTLVEKEFDHVFPFGFTGVLKLTDESLVYTAVAQPPGFDSAYAMLVKLNPDLSLNWSRRYRGLRRDDFAVISQSMDGNLLVGGTMRQQFVSNSGASLYKLDTAGNLIWHKLYSSTFDDRCLAIFEQADSSLMLFIRHGVSNQPTKILHCSASGNILTKRTLYNGTRGIFAEAVAADDSSRYYMSGAWNNTSNGYFETFVLGMTQSTTLWYKHYDFGRGSNSYSIHYTQDGNIMVGGSIEDTTAASATNIYLLKLDRQGNVLWAKEYAQSNGFSEFMSGFSELANGDLLVYGRAHGATSTDGLLFKVNSAGNVMWSTAYQRDVFQTLTHPVPLQGDRWLFNLATTSDPTYLITVGGNGQAACSQVPISLNASNITPSVSSPAYTVNSPNSSVNPITVNQLAETVTDSLLCDAGVGQEEIGLADLIELYPIPCEDQLIIELPVELAASATLYLYNLQGMKLPLSVQYRWGELILNTSVLPEGLYWLSLYTESYTIRKPVLKQ